MTIKVGKYKIRINQRKAFYVTSFSVLALFSFYLFNLGFTVFNITKITQLEKQISFLDRKVGEMESVLITHRNNINLDMAYSLGFKETGEIRFIPRKSVATLLGGNKIQ